MIYVQILVHAAGGAGAAACATGPVADGGQFAVGLAHGAQRAAGGIEKGGDDALAHVVVLGDQTVTQDHGEDALAAVAVVQHDQRQAAEAAVVHVGLTVDGIALAGNLARGAKVHIAAAAGVLGAVAETGGELALDAGGSHSLVGDLVGDVSEGVHL